MPVDEYFAGRPPVLRAIFHAVHGHLTSLGPIAVDPVTVGILFKRSRTFAELRPGRRGFTLSFWLERSLADARVRRTIIGSANRYCHFVPIETAAEVDDTVRSWLSEAYHRSPP